MTRDELIEFIRHEFTPEDIWSLGHQNVLHQWAEDNEYYPGESDYWFDVASDNGYMDVSDRDALEYVCHQMDLSLGPDWNEVAAHHYDNNYEGSITYCTDPFCALGGLA